MNFGPGCIVGVLEEVEEPKSAGDASAFLHFIPDDLLQDRRLIHKTHTHTHTHTH